MFRLSASFAMLLLVIVSGSGAAFAAEKAIPGDLLYSVKRNVNEPIKVSLASNTEERAKVHVELAERRLEEATQLAVSARLDEKTGAKLADEFEASAEQSSQLATELEDAGEADTALAVRSDLEARLSAHAMILTLVAEVGGSEESDPTHTIARRVSEQASMVALLRAESESAVIATTVEETPVAKEAEPAPVVATEPSEPATMMMAAKVSEEVVESAAVQEIVDEVETLVAEDEPVRAFIRSQEAVRAATEASILEKNKDLISGLRLKVEEKAELDAAAVLEDMQVEVRERAVPFLR